MSLGDYSKLSQPTEAAVLESWAKARREYEARGVDVGRLTFEDLFSDIAGECVDLLIEKQKAYGPKNIETLGFHGVFSRLASDKVERLRNMMNGRVVKGQVVIEWPEGDAGDESIEDTLKDIVNYGMILLAVHRGQWSPPLERDL